MNSAQEMASLLRGITSFWQDVPPHNSQKLTTTKHSKIIHMKNSGTNGGIKGSSWQEAWGLMWYVQHRIACEKSFVK